MLFESAGFTDVMVTVRALVVVIPSRADFTRRMVESVAHVVPELAELDSLQRAELAAGKTLPSPPLLSFHIRSDFRSYLQDRTTPSRRPDNQSRFRRMS